MKKQFVYLAVFFNLLFAITTHAQVMERSNATRNDNLALGVIQEINLVRSNPSAYAANLEERKKLYKGNTYVVPGKMPIKTFEGVAAIDEAIQALRSTGRLPALTLSKGMSRAALDHVKDQGGRGLMDHKGTDGSSVGVRVNRYGNWLDGVGENIDFGSDTPREVVVYFLIDDGVKSRGHRKNILGSGFNFIGTATGMHAKYGVMTVVDFANEYSESQPVQTASFLQKAVLISEPISKRSGRHK